MKDHAWKHLRGIVLEFLGRYATEPESFLVRSFCSPNAVATPYIHFQLPLSVHSATIIVMLVTFSWKTCEAIGKTLRSQHSGIQWSVVTELVWAVTWGGISLISSILNVAVAQRFLPWFPQSLTDLTLCIGEKITRYAALGVAISICGVAILCGERAVNVPRHADQ